MPKKYSKPNINIYMPKKFHIISIEFSEPNNTSNPQYYHSWKRGELKNRKPNYVMPRQFPRQNQ